MFVHGGSASFVGGCPRTGAIVFVHGRLSSYMHGRFRTCAVVFKRTWVSGVVGVDVLWSSRTMVVVVVWLSWTHGGWGHCGRMVIGVMVVMASMVGVVVVVASVVGVIVVVVVVVMVTVVVVMGRVLVLVHCCCWWAMGGGCQLCEGRMGTELTYDGDDRYCHHHLDDMAVPCRLPALSAVGAGDVAFLHYCHLMVHAVLVVGG